MSARPTARRRTSDAAAARPQVTAAGTTAAVRFLAQQADPFLRAGMHVSERGRDWLALTGDDITVTLRWRTQRLLLARIHQLQVTADVEQRPATGAPASGELLLRTSGRAGARGFRWQSRRGASPAGLDGPAVAELARSVDLTSCTVTPRQGGWRIVVEPYAGSRLRVFFPPIHYATTVRPEEAATIMAAVGELHSALA